MTRRAGATLPILLLVPLAIGACNRQQEETAAVPDVTASAPYAAEQRSDTGLTTAIQARLYADGTFRNQDVNVRVEDGVATLSGTVDSEEAKQQALNTVRGVEGIARVDDELTVSTEQRADAQGTAGATGTAGYDDRNPGWITTKIQAQYFADPDVRAADIDITTAAGGIVELRGEVDSEQVRSEAVRIATETEGVTRVENNLRIRSDAGQTAMAGRPAETGDSARTVGGGTADAAGAGGDPWLTAKIQSKYFLDTDVKGRNIDVNAANGIVTLRGAVESERERRQAVALARNTDGVIEVRDELQVRPEPDAAAEARQGARTNEAARGTSGTGAIAAVEDAWITTKIQSKYFLDQEVKGHEINVDTRNGVVTLTGSVESDARKRLAEEIARETDGVNRVVNQLTVSQQGQG